MAKVSEKEKSKREEVTKIILETYNNKITRKDFIKEFTNKMDETEYAGYCRQTITKYVNNLDIAWADETETKLVQSRNAFFNLGTIIFPYIRQIRISTYGQDFVLYDSSKGTIANTQKKFTGKQLSELIQKRDDGEIPKTTLVHLYIITTIPDFNQHICNVFMNELPETLFCNVHINCSEIAFELRKIKNFVNRSYAILRRGKIRNETSTVDVD